MAQLWGGRFTKETDELVKQFNDSLPFDKRLYEQDIQGSVVHAAMLGKQGIITDEEAEKIIEYIQEEDPAENEPAEESAYNAFLVYGVCDEMDIDACVVTITDGSGESRSYNEVVLDGELYILNATEDGGVLEQYTPEEIN